MCVFICIFSLYKPVKKLKFRVQESVEKLRHGINSRYKEQFHYMSAINNRPAHVYD